ncbi:MAG TPA: DUF4013 domain-containing protein [Candidatus Sulfomarinibacteraceae bacterium]|nr:DUF4013 domain-containing protein [Candidatus Sulfomarinibacteraceae bacterium]
MDIGKAFTFVTEDEEWLVKLGIAAVASLLSFLFFPIFLLVGYMVGVTRNVYSGAKRPLPQWDDLGRLFKDGILVSIGQFVYTLPVWILVCVGMVATIGFSGLEEFNPDAMVAVMGTTWAVLACLMAILAVALFFISPAIFIQYVRHENFGAMMRVGEVLGIARDNLVPIIMAAVASFAASLALSVAVAALNVVPCLGAIVGVILSIMAGPWIMVAMGHMYGQIAGSDEMKVTATF